MLPAFLINLTLFQWYSLCLNNGVFCPDVLPARQTETTTRLKAVKTQGAHFLVDLLKWGEVRKCLGHENNTDNTNDSELLA